MLGHLAKALVLGAGMSGAIAMTSCSTAPSSATGKEHIIEDADAALAEAKRNDPSIAKVLGDAAGYAVFPSVGKGAIGIGGAYGKGVLYEHGSVVGYCDLSQATIGLQLGGQAYTEILVFQTKDAVEEFKNGDISFDAQATAVAIKSGAGANAKFKDGIAVFTMDEAGLMYEASIGGQRFSYLPKS